MTEEKRDDSSTMEFRGELNPEESVAAVAAQDAAPEAELAGVAETEVFDPAAVAAAPAFSYRYAANPVEASIFSAAGTLTASPGGGGGWQPAAASGKTLYLAAGLWRRLMAFLLDMGVIAILSHLLLLIPALNGPGRLTEIIFRNSLCLGLIGLLYFTLTTGFTGQSLGKMMVGIRVIKLDGSRLDWRTVILREVVGRTVSQLLGCGLGYLTVLFTPKRLALHDILADTGVVYDHPGHSPQELWVTPASGTENE